MVTAFSLRWSARERGKQAPSPQTCRMASKKLDMTATCDVSTRSCVHHPVAMKAQVAVVDPLFRQGLVVTLRGKSSSPGTGGVRRDIRTAA
jgi:hypothetical protein